MRRPLLFLLLLTVAALSGLLLWRVVAGGGTGPEPVPAAEFRLVSVDGRLPGAEMCRRTGIRRARLVLRKDGRWRMREERCRPAPAWVTAGTWRRSGDTLLVMPVRSRGGEVPRAGSVLRGDTLDLPVHRGQTYLYRFVRVAAN